MSRFLAPILVLVVATAVVLVAASSVDDGNPGSAATGGAGSVPPLRDPGALRPPALPAAPPLGLYPALSAQRGLALPPARALALARRFAASREGRISFAVLGPGGRIAGVRPGDQHESASLIKAMILVSYLRQLAAQEREPSELELLRMDDMIRVSDNFSTSQLYEEIGPDALEELAREAGMRSFASSVFWGNCLVTAADQVRLFLALDRLLPAAYRDFARGLLEHIASFHSWGIPKAARPAWRVLFKGGWRPDDEQGEIVHQAALLERGSRKLAIAVMTDQNPSEPYGHRTIEGIARRLVSGGVEPGVLAPLPSLDGYRPPDPRLLGPSA